MLIEYSTRAGFVHNQKQNPFKSFAPVRNRWLWTDSIFVYKEDTKRKAKAWQNMLEEPR